MHLNSREGERATAAQSLTMQAPARVGDTRGVYIGAVSVSLHIASSSYIIVFLIAYFLSSFVGSIKNVMSLLSLVTFEPSKLSLSVASGALN